MDTKSVKSLIEKIENNKKTIRRDKIKLSPKKKCSPVYKVRSLKSSKILTNSGHKSTKKVDRNVDKKV